MRTFLLAAATVLLAGSLLAEGQSQRYIVILKQRSGVVPDIAALGGTIESQQEEQLVVTIPIASLAALRADTKIRYVERVGGAPAEGEDSLIGVPADPTPGTASNARFTPHALGSTPWSSGDYVYDGAGNIVSIGSDTYAYDGVQRLRQSATRGTPETYTYDGFGNMTAKTNNGLAQQVPSVETATNRYTGTGYSYNEIGAMVTGASYLFTYDALGQPLSKKYNNDSSTQEYYIYTPGDERVGVQRGTWWTWSVRDEGGKVLRQYRSSTTHPTDPSLWLEDFVWRDGLLLGSQRPPELGGRRHYHLDHLGTPRLVTADNGLRISLHDYFPFGDESTPVSQEVAAGYDREDPMKFTGHERDYAWGMGAEDPHAIDDMHARYESPSLGRFLSVDPLEGDSRDPQSWNRYAYVRNNPMDRTDPDGRADKKWNVQQIINEASEYVEGIENGYVSSVAFEIGHHAPTSDLNALGQAVGSTIALVQSVDEAGTGAAVSAAGGMVTVLSGGTTGPVTVPAVAVGGVAVVHGTISAGVSIVNIASAMSSVNQMNKEVKTGQAPSQVKRVDKPHNPGEQDHVHLNDKKGSALNKDGTWRHHMTQLTNATAKWLESHGWTLP